MKTTVITLLFLFSSAVAVAQTDQTECQDHSIITRYPGAEIVYCDTKNYSEYGIAIGPETGYRTIDEWINVSGNQTRIYYSIKGDVIVNEVYQNYLTALNNGDFSLLANKMHQESNVSKEVGGNTWLITFYRANPFPSNVGILINAGSGTMGGTFYIAGKKDNIYLIVSGKRYSDNETVILLDVLETQEMEDNLISVNADYIAEMLFSEGKVALQGILFDHNQATIQNESIPILEEISTFLKEHPATEIFVVGHTDMTGEVQYNIDLSGRRAKAVTDYLITQHQIASNRLLPHGVGPLAPADNNRTDSGRAKNRRVELVLKSN